MRSNHRGHRAAGSKPDAEQAGDVSGQDLGLVESRDCLWIGHVAEHSRYRIAWDELDQQETETATLSRVGLDIKNRLRSDRSTGHPRCLMIPRGRNASSVEIEPGSPQHINSSDFLLFQTTRPCFPAGYCRHRRPASHRSHSWHPPRPETPQRPPPHRACRRDRPG